MKKLKKMEKIKDFLFNQSFINYYNLLIYFNNNKQYQNEIINLLIKNNINIQIIQIFKASNTNKLKIIGIILFNIFRFKIFKLYN